MKNEVTLQIDWIKRLKNYTDKVRESTDNEVKHKMAILALLGYLDSLEFLYNKDSLYEKERFSALKERR